MKVVNETEGRKEDNIVASIGMFDGVHIGHQTLVDFLKTEAGKRNMEPAVITFKEHPQQVLRSRDGVKMIMPLDERLKCLERLGIETAIVLNFSMSLSVMDSFEFMKLLRDKYGVKELVIGYNHRFGHNAKETFADYVRHGKTLGMEVVQAPEYRGEHSPVSSSVIRKLISTGKVDDAMQCMGRPFSLKGVVEHGMENGRTIGYPTANVGRVNPQLIMPHRGAYAVKIVLEDGKIFDGMANIGVRPTIESRGEQTVEVHLFDFNANIYDSAIELYFIKFLRTELKMDSLDELKKQLEEDERKSREVLAAITLDNK